MSEIWRIVMASDIVLVPEAVIYTMRRRRARGAVNHLASFCYPISKQSNRKHRLQQFTTVENGPSRRRREPRANGSNPGAWRTLAAEGIAKLSNSQGRPLWPPVVQQMTPVVWAGERPPRR